MMLKLVVFILHLAVCCAQEHLTCMRTDNILTEEKPQVPKGIALGLPGKRGEKGNMGSRGIQGQKGEPGIPDNYQMNLLQDQLNSLSQEMRALKKQNRKYLNVIETELNIVFLHSNVYKITPNTQSWQASRQFCQNWGGDLVVHGVKTLESRTKLIASLVVVDRFWIGANASEDNWIWVNDEPASSSDLIWDNGEPNNWNNLNQDCVLVHANPGSAHGRADDEVCSNEFKGLCEKKL